MLSDFILSRPVPTPTVMAVYPVSAFSGVADAVVLATVNLDWMSKVMSNLGGRAGITAVLVDSAGTVLAAPADEAQRDRPSARQLAADVRDRRQGAEV